VIIKLKKHAKAINSHTSYWTKQRRNFCPQYWNFQMGIVGFPFFQSQNYCGLSIAGYRICVFMACHKVPCTPHGIMSDNILSLSCVKYMCSETQALNRCIELNVVSGWTGFKTMCTTWKRIFFRPFEYIIQLCNKLFACDCQWILPTKPWRSVLGIGLELIIGVGRTRFESHVKPISHLFYLPQYYNFFSLCGKLDNWMKMEEVSIVQHTLNSSIVPIL
jgi:hypothetical protein